MFSRRRREIAVAAGTIVVLVLAASRGLASGQSPDSVTLYIGCNNVTLAAPIGTPLRALAQSVLPAGALTGVFRYDTAAGRFVAFAPSAPDAVNDYTSVTLPLEAAFICVSTPATFLRGTITPITQAPPVVVTRQLGVTSAPRELVRGESATVVLSLPPMMVCIGGVNIPAGSTFHFIPIEVAGRSGGTAIIRFDTASTDGPGFAYLAIRCSDGSVIRLEIRVT